MSDIYPYSMYYQNNAGDVINFTEAPYSVDSTDLFDSLCTLSSVGRPLSEGIRVTGKYRECSSRSLKVNVFGETQAAHDAAIDELAGVTGKDLELLKAGKLYINGQYLSCYINQSEKQLSLNWSNCTTVSLSIMPEYPYWCLERKYSYYERDDEDSAVGLKYSKSYPYQYTPNKTMRLINSHYAACPMIITIYGAVSNPVIYVGDQPYGLNVTLAAGEYATINQVTREIYAYDSQGQAENIFSLRDKSGDVFKFAPAGYSQLNFSGNFGIDIVIVEQRSEPLWS